MAMFGSKFNEKTYPNFGRIIYAIYTSRDIFTYNYIKGVMLSKYSRNELRLYDT